MGMIYYIKTRPRTTAYSRGFLCDKSQNSHYPHMNIPDAEKTAAAKCPASVGYTGAIAIIGHSSYETQLLKITLFSSKPLISPPQNHGQSAPQAGKLDCLDFPPFTTLVEASSPSTVTSPSRLHCSDDQHIRVHIATPTIF